MSKLIAGFLLAFWLTWASGGYTTGPFKTYKACTQYGQSLAHLYGAFTCHE